MDLILPSVSSEKVDLQILAFEKDLFREIKRSS